MFIWPLKQIRKVKKLDKWVPYEQTTNFKKIIIWSIVFSYSMQQQWTISQSDCDVKLKVDFIWQPAMTSTSQSKTCTKNKGSWPLFRGLLPVWSTTAFWILVKLLPLRSMLSKLIRCTENWNAWSQCWKGPILLHNAWLCITQSALQKFNELG